MISFLLLIIIITISDKNTFKNLYYRYNAYKCVIYLLDKYSVCIYIKYYIKIAIRIFAPISFLLSEINSICDRINLNWFYYWADDN